MLRAGGLVVILLLFVVGTLVDRPDVGPVAFGFVILILGLIAGAGLLTFICGAGLLTLI